MPGIENNANEINNIPLGNPANKYQDMHDFMGRLKTRSLDTEVLNGDISQWLDNTSEGKQVGYGMTTKIKQRTALEVLRL